MANGLRYGDAIHAATAAWSECDQLWTFDGDFKGDIVEGSKRCVPTRPSMEAFGAIKSLVPKPYTPGQPILDPLQDSLDLDDPWVDDDDADDDA
ncbi:MAG: type II toxin-antitoxin system VapC family toxin [Fimbriimonadaceae bacterium]|nr:type II toxin-antitoxin system VapC family toxin [Fimbriimonadaceae bacterium]